MKFDRIVMWISILVAFVFGFFAVYLVLCTFFPWTIGMAINPISHCQIIGKSREEVVARYGDPDCTAIVNDEYVYLLEQEHFFRIRFREGTAQECLYGWGLVTQNEAYHENREITEPEKNVQRRASIRGRWGVFCFFGFLAMFGAFAYCIYRYEIIPRIYSDQEQSEKLIS